MNQTQEIYRINQLPIFQNRMYDSEEEAINCPRGDMRLVEDFNTGLIYNSAFHSELMQYDHQYQNEQAVSPVFRAHLKQVSEIISRTIGKRSIVEIGSGKGFFLEMLAAEGFSVTGFDPAYEGDNPAIVRDYFKPGLEIRAEGIVLRHVLEHVWDPVTFLQTLKQDNGVKRKIYIEVPCFDWICQHRAWFDIFYEHVNYFRISDFKRMFGTIHECGKLFNGQYLYVVAELSTLRRPKYDKSNRVPFPDDFLRCLDKTARAAECKRPSVVWGGASKGVIFSLLKARHGDPVNMVIDINPEKQNRYLPATGLKVQSPEEALPALPRGASIFVMNSNYLDEIVQMSGSAYHCIGIDYE